MSFNPIEDKVEVSTPMNEFETRKSSLPLIPLIIAGVVVVAAIIIAGYSYTRGDISLMPAPSSGGDTVDITYSGKEYRLSYGDRKEIKPLEIASFEEDSGWSGDGTYDYTTYFEGGSSLSLTSKEQEKAVASLAKSMDFGGLSDIRLFVFVKDDPMDIQDIDIVFSNNSSTGLYRYPVRGLKKGWNQVTAARDQFVEETAPAPKVSGRNATASGSTQVFGWENIEKISFELTARPKSKTTVNFDLMWGERDVSYLKDWNTPNEQMLGMGNSSSGHALRVINFGGSLATLSKVGSGGDFKFQAKLIPQKTGAFGLFVRGDYKTGLGYYLTLDGVDKNSWSVYKNVRVDGKVTKEVIKSGDIRNFLVEKNKPYYLRGELAGRKIGFYFSNDGVSYTKLAEANDAEYGRGGIGLVLSGGTIILADEFIFTQ